MNKLPAYILTVLLLSFGIGILGAAEAQIQFSDAAKVYNGSAQTISVQTIPAGLEVEVTYNGSAEPPTNAGDYAVTATVINNPEYMGSASTNFQITKAEFQVEIGNLQQTFNGKYLPVSISIPSEQSIPASIIPNNLQVAYGWEHGGGSAISWAYTRSEGSNSYELSQEPQYNPINGYQNTPERTNAGNHTVQVSYDDGNVSCTSSATLVVAKGQLSHFLTVGHIIAPNK
jgi:hypothetical protein